VASVSTPGDDAGGGIRRFSAFLFRHPRLKLGVVLGAPLLWFTVVYLGALAVLFVSAFWRLDVFTAEIVKQFGFSNFETLLREPVYRTIAVRTIGIAAAVTLTDIALSFPLAYFAARVATPRVRNALLLMVVIPLWANYLVRIFAWKLILSPGGFLDSAVRFLGFSLQIANSNWAIWITFVYLWLPFTLLPIYGAMERVPSSYLEASSDLGARGWITFRRVVFPLIVPGIVAGSIFSFSLTLGDYIAPSLVGNTQFIGTVIYQSTGVSNNVPFGAAYAFVPMLVIAAYLVIAKRMGAFDAL
jgi:putative spermidine/putrescine transport system permease protein